MLNCFRLWQWRGITIHFQEERLALAPDDKMFALLIGATEQCIDIDKQLRQERAAQSAAGRRARGETLGPAPWGFRLYCTRLVPDEKEQQILAYIRHLAVSKLKCNRGLERSLRKCDRRKHRWEFPMGEVLRTFPLGTESQRWPVILRWKSVIE